MTTSIGTADTTALFMLHGCLRSTPGNGHALAGILAENDAAEPMPGCRLYLVATDPEDPDAVWVTEVWDTTWVGDERIVDVHIGNLRRKLGTDTRGRGFIDTVRGVGYRVGQP